MRSSKRSRSGTTFHILGLTCTRRKALCSLRICPPQSYRTMRRAIDHLPKCRDQRASGIPDTGGAHATCGDYAVQHKRLRIRKTKVREFGQVEQLKKGANDRN